MADESFMGYVLRLTEQNVYETPSWVLKLAGLDYKQLRRSCAFVFKPESAAGLAQVTDVGATELARLTYPPVVARDGNSLYRFFGQPLPQYALRPTQPKVCPQCLAETAHCRRVWEFSLVTACPRHGCLLIDKCPKCKAPISWLRDSLCVCPCKFDWRKARVNRLEENELALACHIHSLCGLDGNAPPNSGGRNPALALELQDLISAVSFIAGQYQGLLTVTGKQLARCSRNVELHALYARAFAVFEDWPINFYRFLDWRRSQAGNILPSHRSLATGLCKDFGKFHTGLFRKLPGQQFDFMRVAFAEYLTKHWAGGYLAHLNRQEGRAVVRSEKYVSRTEARRLLQTHVRWIDHLVQSGRLKAVVRRRNSKRFVLVEVASLTRLKYEFSRLLSFEEVRKQLGVGRRKALAWIREGRLKPERGPTVDGFAQWRFAPSTVDHLFEKVA